MVLPSLLLAGSLVWLVGADIHSFVEEKEVLEARSETVDGVERGGTGIGPQWWYDRAGRKYTCYVQSTKTAASMTH